MENTLLKTDLNHRIFGLDILRSIAILTVLIGHSNHMLPEALKDISSKIFFFDGVTIFFVLSGFLIGNILIKSFNKEDVSTKTLSKFWINRWFRTLPPYLFILLVLVFTTYVLEINHCGWTSFPSKKEVLHYFFFLQNFSWPSFDFFLESWSLAVEEWFYILTPIVAFLIHKGFKVNIKYTFLVTIFLFLVFSLLIRYFKYMEFPDLDLDSHFRKQVVTRFDSLMLGVLAAYILYYHKAFWKEKKYYFLIVGLVLFLLPQIIGLNDIKAYLYVWSFLLESFAIFCFLPLLHSIADSKGIIYKIITYISLISYSLYLLHFSFLQHTVLNHYFYEYSDTTKWILYWVLSFSLGTIMYLYIEKPFMNLRKKFN